jgi:hypothetical protein
MISVSRFLAGPAEAGRYLLPIAALMLLIVTGACGSPTAPELLAGAIRINGTVHYYTFEGGFWAVRGDDGVTYDPIDGLPPAFQRENLRVTLVAKIRTDTGSIHMAGPLVEILSIEAR